MLNIDVFPHLYWEKTISGDLGSKNIANIMRYNDKILIDAQDRTYEYSMKRNRLGWTFEGLLRSVGLAAGTVFGGVVGGATLGSIGSGIGRGVGEHLGNKIYGKTMHDLDQVVEDYKFRQLSNQYILEANNGTRQMLNELYNQSYQEDLQTLQQLGQDQI